MRKRHHFILGALAIGAIAAVILFPVSAPEAAEDCDAGCAQSCVIELGVCQGVAANNWQFCLGGAVSNPACDQQLQVELRGCQSGHHGCLRECPGQCLDYGAGPGAPPGVEIGLK